MTTDHWSQAIKIVLSLMIVVAFFGVIASLLFLDRADLQPGIREVLLILVGVLAGAFKDCIGYWIGSSASSQRKDALLAAKVP